MPTLVELLEILSHYNDRYSFSVDVSFLREIVTKAIEYDKIATHSSSYLEELAKFENS